MTTPPGKPTEGPENPEPSAPPESDRPQHAPPESAPDDTDPFASFEDGDDGMEAEPTRIDTDQMLAEQPTSIVRDTGRQPPFLRVMAGADRGKEFILAVGETGVGRAIENDVILTDISVSRHHMKVRFDGTRIELEDLGSGNGTLLNGRRIRRALLAEGDRIEIGETEFVVKVPSPLAPKRRLQRQEQPPLADPPSESDPNSVTPEISEAPPPPAHVSTGPSPHGRTVAVSRRTVWLLGVAAFLLVAAFGAIAVIFTVRSRAGDELASARASDRMAEMGKEAFAAGRWDEAEQAFQEVLTVHNNDRVAQAYLEQIREVREHQGYVQEARGALQQNDPMNAMVRAAAVPETSPLYAEANAVRLAAQTRLMTNIDGRIRDALDAQDFDGARRLLEEAQSVEPDSETVQRIARTIAEVEARAADRGERSSPREKQITRGATHSLELSQTRQRVVRVYKRGAFGEAVQIAESAMSTLPAAERPPFARLAEQIERFAVAYGAVERAGNDLSSVIEEAQRAITLDAQISGGHFAGALRQRLVATQLRIAETAVGRGDMVAGCKNVRFVLQSDRNNSGARALSARCETAANEMIASAQRLEERDPRRAREIYRKVMSMQPSTSESYQTAYRRLNASVRPIAQDEDE